MVLVSMVFMDTYLSEFRKHKGNFYKETSNLKDERRGTTS